MLVLTDSEAKLLKAMGESSGSTYYQLASGAELTPSEVSRAVEFLVRKDLARSAQNQAMVTLTDQGRIVRRLMEGAKSRYSQMRDSVRVTVVPDNAYGEINERWAGFSADEDIDAALDEAIDNMRAENNKP